jgi:DNA primase small subunit
LLDPKSKNPDESSFFARREFSFTLENDIYMRYQYCYDRNELKEKIIKFNPQKIDIGAVFFSTV